MTPSSLRRVHWLAVACLAVGPLRAAECVCGRVKPTGLSSGAVAGAAGLVLHWFPSGALDSHPAPPPPQTASGRRCLLGSGASVRCPPPPPMSLAQATMIFTSEGGGGSDNGGHHSSFREGGPLHGGGRGRGGRLDMSPVFHQNFCIRIFWPAHLLEALLGQMLCSSCLFVMVVELAWPSFLR